MIFKCEDRLIMFLDVPLVDTRFLRGATTLGTNTSNMDIVSSYDTL